MERISGGSLARVPSEDSPPFFFFETSCRVYVPCLKALLLLMLSRAMFLNSMNVELCDVEFAQITAPFLQTCISIHGDVKNASRDLELLTGRMVIFHEP